MDVIPEIIATPGMYVVKWPYPTGKVDFEAGRLRTHTDGRVQAVVKINITWPGTDRADRVHHESMNLASGQTRRRLAQTLEERFDGRGPNWDQLIEKSCMAILEAEESGEPVLPITYTTDLSVDYIVDPLLLNHHPVVLFAPGGSAKSYVGMYLALLVQNGLPLLGRPSKQTGVLFLDWETLKSEADRSFSKLINGMAVDPGTIKTPLYRRCTGRLSDNVTDIAGIVAEHRIGFIVVDSLGPAAGGDIMAPETAVGFYEALRKITAGTEAGAVILAHVSKENIRDEQSKRLPFGSIFFTNLARAAWEVRTQEQGDDRLDLSLFCRKNNLAKPGPIGLRLTFDGDERITVAQASAEDVLTEQGALQDMILHELKRGPMQVADIIEAVAASPASVRMTLSRLGRRGAVVNATRGMWALACNREES